MGLRETLEGRKAVLAFDLANNRRRADDYANELAEAQRNIERYTAEIAEIDRVLATMPEPQPAITGDTSGPAPSTPRDDV